MVTRKAIERLYTDRCTIEAVNGTGVDAITGQTVTEEGPLVTDEPCRLSYRTIQPTYGAENVSRVSQIIVLFLRPDIIVPPGSAVTVKRFGATTEYESSGQPAVHSAHQEIVLELRKEHA